MDNRKRIGLIYNYNENWIGGTYYIENIIFALNTLDDNEKPVLTIFSNSSKQFEKLKKNVFYPYIKFELFSPQLSLLKRVINKFMVLINKKPLFIHYIKNENIDFVYPNPVHNCFSKIENIKKGYWIPDFQEEHLPNFFSKEEIIDRRKKNLNFTSSSDSKIIFSSKDSENDFKYFYPQQKVKKYILPFIVNPIDITLNEAEIKKTLYKYQIPYNFILIPNQLWIHKNHQIIIEATKEIKKLDKNIVFVCTGKEVDNRFPNYPETLKKQVEEFKFEKQIRFLGFIPKNDLESLFLSAKAILQPSLFEGWNTTIEIAKSLNKFIIASDINVHLEQLEEYPNYSIFKKNDPKDLVNRIILLSENKDLIKKFDYKKKQREFAKLFISIID